MLLAYLTQHGSAAATNSSGDHGHARPFHARHRCRLLRAVGGLRPRLWPAL